MRFANSAIFMDISKNLCRSLLFKKIKFMKNFQNDFKNLKK